MTKQHPYLMEGTEEATRLEIKTGREALMDQAEWFGVRSGLSVLDVGCGPGKTTSILHDMVQPGGEVLGIDFSKRRIERARQQYGGKLGIDFQLHNFYDSLDDFGHFDLIWVRFVLEYHLQESPHIVGNLVRCLKPGGYLCLADLDHNAMNHYPLPEEMTRILCRIVALLERKYNFDPYAGRKLYSYLFDRGLRNIQVDLRAHHLIYGESNDVDMFNWIKKLEMVTNKAPEVFEDYPGGHSQFFDDFSQFFSNPRRFTYTPLILCKGMNPLH